MSKSNCYFCHNGRDCSTVGKCPNCHRTREDGTKVIFRKLEGEVIALFPELPGDNNPITCLSYMRIGQHGSASAESPLGIPAKESEYDSLFQELESIGYDDLRIAYKLTRADYLKRKTAINGIRES